MKTTFTHFMLLFVFILAHSTLFSQEANNLSEEDIKAVATENIPDFTRSVGLKILEINNQIISERRLNKEKKEVDSITNKINVGIQKSDSFIFEQLTMNKLEKLERQWQSISTELTAIISPLNNKVQAYGAYYNIIDNYYQIALETIISNKRSNISSEVKESLRNTKNDLREFRAQIKETQNQYLKLTSQCNELANKVSNQLNNIKVARSKIVRNLLIAEQSPLWTAIKNNKNDTLLITEESNISFAKNSVKNYWNTNRSVPFFLITIFLLSWIITRLLKKALLKANLQDEINQQNATKVIINQPVLISIMVTWFIFAIGFYSPIEVRAIWLTFTLIPLLLIANALFKKQSITNTLIFSAFYLYRGFEFLYDETTITARIFTLLLDVTSILILLKLSKSNSEVINKEKWFFKAVSYTLIGLIIGSFLFNILGNVRLSNILIVGSIDVIITGILLLIAFHVFNGLIKLFIISPQAKKLNVIKNHNEVLLKSVRNTLLFMASAYWISISFEHFGIREEVMAWVKKHYFQEFHFGNTSFALNNIVAFFLAVYFSIVVSRILRLILEEDVFTRSKTDKGTSSTIILLFRYSVISLGFLFAMSVAGIELEKISIIIGALGVGIGFGLQNIFNNLVSGIILAFERPIAVDDIIEVGSLTGIVKEIGFRSSRVRTYDGAEVIVPNGDIVSNQMINWTLSDRKRRLKIDFGVSYDANPEEVIEVMKEITHENPSIVQEPAPRPRFVEFGDSSLNFQLLFWISDYENSFGIGTETMLSLYSKLKERGIEIPFPQRDIRIVDVTKNKESSKLTK